MRQPILLQVELAEPCNHSHKTLENQFAVANPYNGNQSASSIPKTKDCPMQSIFFFIDANNFLEISQCILFQ